MQGRRIRGEREHVDERTFVERERRRRIKRCRCSGDERMIKTRLPADGYLNAGHIGGIRHTNPKNVNGSDAGRICRDIA